MEQNYTKIDHELPLIPLRGLAIFPYMILNFDIGREMSLKALDQAMLEDECTDSNREKCKTCKDVRKSYPEITDRILLELICILSEWRTYLDSSYTIKANNTLHLKQDILKDFLELFKWYEFKKCEKGIKQQVRTLFEER